MWIRYADRQGGREVTEAGGQGRRGGLGECRLRWRWAFVESRYHRRTNQVLLYKGGVVIRCWNGEGNDLFIGVYFM